MSAKSGKPPLPSKMNQTTTTSASEAGKAHPLFGSGPIPKNKDMNGFVDKINQ
jgi:hypothetical protein